MTGKDSLPSEKSESNNAALLEKSNTKQVKKVEFIGRRWWKISALLVASFSIFALQSQRRVQNFNWPQRDDEKFGRVKLRSLQFDTLSFSSDDLCHLVFQMFQDLGLPRHFELKETKLKTFILSVREAMPVNPYHNWFHVVDVTQAVFSLLLETDLLRRLDQIQLFALLVSALCHDLDHPGVNNPFLIASRGELAMLYNDRSPLENHHSSLTFRLLHRSDINLLDNLTDADYAIFRKVVINNILATDMGRHSEFASRLNAVTSSAVPTDPQFAMEVLLKYADISSVWRPFDVAQQWGMRVTNEFFEQGDEERRRGMPVSPGMDRRTASRVAVQRGFIDAIVAPYSRAMALLLPPLVATSQQLARNRAAWAAINDTALGAFCSRPAARC